MFVRGAYRIGSGLLSIGNDVLSNDIYSEATGPILGPDFFGSIYWLEDLECLYENWLSTAVGMAT